MSSGSVASLLSAGGAGTIFEYRVAAVVLAALLRGDRAKGLEVPVTEVRLQRRIANHQGAYRVVINEHRSFRGGCPVGGAGPGDLRLRRVGASDRKRCRRQAAGPEDPAACPPG